MAWYLMEGHSVWVNKNYIYKQALTRCMSADCLCTQIQISQAVRTWGFWVQTPVFLYFTHFFIHSLRFQHSFICPSIHSNTPVLPHRHRPWQTGHPGSTLVWLFPGSKDRRHSHRPAPGALPRASRQIRTDAPAASWCCYTGSLQGPWTAPLQK